MIGQEKAMEPNVIEGVETVIRENQIELKVGNLTEYKKLATAILRYFEERRRPVLVFIGEKALYVAMKAIIWANMEASSNGFRLLMIPSYEERLTTDKRTEGAPDITLTAIRLTLGRAPIVV
jgi:stage V sporulation protein SpoVS